MAKRHGISSTWYQLTMLAIESQTVMALRMMRLAKGGKVAAREAQRMVTEKAIAGSVAAATIMAGGGVDNAIKKTRARVRRNTRRLTR
jgi:hypothetical protein